MDKLPPWLRYAMIVVGLFTVVILGISFLIRYIAGWNPLGFLSRPAQANVVTTNTIVTGLQSLGQVVTISAQVAKADIAVTANTGGLNLCGHTGYHVAQGAIDAGIDITQITDDSVSYNQSTDTYTLTLPAPTITSCRIEYIRQYQRSGGNPTCGIDWDNVRLLANYVTMVEFAEDTLEGGILERAESETTVVMQSFIRSLTGGEVVISYATSDETTTLPSSCQPQIPAGWMLDEETGQWVPTP